MATALSVRKPRESTGDRHTRQMHETAAKLQRLTGGKMTMSFHAGTFFSEDHGSRNQLIIGHLDCDSEADFVNIDVRKGDPVKLMVKELKPISRLYRKIARRVEARTV